MPEHTQTKAWTDDLLERAHAAVEMATKHGADGVWATTSAMRSTECQVRDGKLETMKQSNSRSLSLELYVDGRYFTHTTNDLREAQLASFVKDAVGLTRALERDPHRELPDPKLFAGRTTADLQLFDDSVEALDVDGRIARCMAADARVHGKPKVLSVSTSFTDVRGESAAVSSNGFEGSRRGTWVSLGCGVTMQDEGDRRPEDGMWASHRHLADLPDAVWIGDQALERAQGRIGSRKGPTATTTMIVDRIAASQLVAMLISPADGGAIQQGRSLWAERRGKPVLAKRLEIVDDPHVARATGSRAYDDEGIATRRRTVVAQGALQTIFVDTYYAKKLGIAPTTGGWSNLVVTPGKGSARDLAADVRHGIYVTDWLGGNADDTTGDFSLGLRGHLVEKGKIGGPIGEMNATGNLLDLFARVVAVGDDTWTHGWMRTPSIAFAKVSFSGA
jgi:PmbA protein